MSTTTPALNMTFANVVRETDNLREHVENLPQVDNEVGILQTLARLEEGQAEIRNNIAELKLQQLAADFNQIARIENTFASSLKSRLFPLKNQANELPVNFPAVHSDIWKLTAAESDILLDFYGQPTGDLVEASRARFASYIGVRSIPFH